MPSMPPTFRPSGRVDAAERKRAVDQARPSAAKRGYDRTWRRIRDRIVIARGCRCEAEDCGSLVVLRRAEATPSAPVAHVDHIDGDAWNRAPTNLRVLCEPCHDSRTARDQGFGRKGRGGSNP